MSNRLPPAWSKHLKTSSGPKISQPKIAQPKANPPSQAQADDALPSAAAYFQQNPVSADGIMARP
ncbi:hypothetical protein FJW08_08930 [Mesorhizobium sp. B3-2-1]|nr:hypothetical protein FJW08_08930 [Mesorhizobium sp. B3-2-1]